MYSCCCVGGIIIEPPACGSPELGALIGIGQETTYLDTGTRSLQICCRVKGPPNYIVTWLLNGNPIGRQSGYEFGDDYMRYTGPLTQGCVNYTCRVNFREQERVLAETSEICIGSESAVVHVAMSMQSLGLYFMYVVVAKHRHVGMYEPYVPAWALQFVGS